MFFMFVQYVCNYPIPVCIMCLQMLHSNHPFLWVSLVILPYRLYHSTNPLDKILCLQKANEYMFFSEWSILMRPRIGIHRKTSFRSSFLLLQQCLACFDRFTWIVCKWPFSCCFVGKWSQDSIKTTCSISIEFFSMCFVRPSRASMKWY